MTDLYQRCDNCGLATRRVRYVYRVYITSEEDKLHVSLCGLCWSTIVPPGASRRLHSLARGYRQVPLPE